jgi:hypothetical protein
MTSQARKERRKYERWLKKYDMKAYQEYKSGVMARGKQMHQEFTESIENRLNEDLEHRQANLIESLEAKGLSRQEIDEQVEEWVARLKIWRSDEKPKRLREIRRERNSQTDDKN